MYSIGSRVRRGGYQRLSGQLEVELSRCDPVPVRHISRGRQRRDEASHLLWPSHIARDADLDVLGALRFTVGQARRCARERLQGIVIRPVELAPDTEVDTIVEADRAPFVCACTRVPVRATAAGIPRKPLPVNMTGSARRPRRRNPRPAFRSSSCRFGSRSTCRPARSRRICRCRPTRPPAPGRAWV